MSCYSSKTDLDTLINLNPNLTFINLEECVNKLLVENYIKENSDLLIIVQENFNISNKDNFNYEIYTKDGTKIANLSICDNTKKEISKPLTDFNNIDLYTVEFLSKQGYDIFNKSSSFYYDYCLSAYINQSDLSINLRQQEIYPKNITLCPEICEYNGINYESKRVDCICNINISEKIDFFEEVETNFFFYIIDLINYKIILCYDKIFDPNNYIYNFGFYIGVFVVFSFIFLNFIYQFFGKKSIRKKYFDKKPNLEKIKEIEKNFNKKYLNLGIKIRDEHKKSLFFESQKQSPRITLNDLKKDSEGKNSNPGKKKKLKKKKSKKKCKILIQDVGSINSNIKYSSGNLKLMKTNSSINKNSDAFPKNIFSLNKSTQNTTISNDKKGEKIDYNELLYREAIEIDKRNIIQIFISIFVLKLQAIQITFYPKDFIHFSLSLSLYLFDILLDLTINSLLFSDEILSQKYFNNGDLLLLTTNILSITSNIVSFLILYLLDKLINHYEVFDVITKEFKQKKNFLIIFIKLKCCFKVIISIFYLILLIIGLFCTYYLFIFFSIYKKLQKDLFVNYIVGTFWSLGYTVFVCLLVTITRKLSIKKKIKRLYIISKFIDEKF